MEGFFILLGLTRLASLPWSLSRRRRREQEVRLRQLADGGGGVVG